MPTNIDKLLAEIDSVLLESKRMKRDRIVESLSQPTQRMFSTSRFVDLSTFEILEGETAEVDNQIAYFLATARPWPSSCVACYSAYLEDDSGWCRSCHPAKGFLQYDLPKASSIYTPQRNENICDPKPEIDVFDESSPNLFKFKL